MRPIAWVSTASEWRAFCEHGIRTRAHKWAGEAEASAARSCEATKQLLSVSANSPQGGLQDMLERRHQVMDMYKAALENRALAQVLSAALTERSRGSPGEVAVAWRWGLRKAVQCLGPLGSVAAPLRAALAVLRWVPGFPILYE